MKNKNCSDVSERRALNLHLRYICLISVIALVAAVCIIAADIYTRGLRESVDAAEADFTDELDRSLSKLSTVLYDAASVSDSSVFSHKMTDAVLLCGRVCGALSTRREFDCDLLARYMALLNDELEELRQHAFLEMSVGESMHERCASAAASIEKIAVCGKEGDSYSAAKISLIVSPLI